MNNNYYIVLIVFFVFAFAFSLIINSLLLKFAHTLGIRDRDEAIIRWSTGAKPALGGISFYLIFLLSLILYPWGKNVPEGLLNINSLGIFAACTIGFLMGLYDDAYDTKPWLKFFSQLACGFILCLTGTYIQIFESELLNYALTIFWVVGIMNAINLLDNMDGITTIVSIGILLSIIGILIYNNDLNNNMTLLIAGVLASLIGFLFFNWHPSKMFMGDTGSQFIGIFLASMGIIFFWNGENYEGHNSSWIQITGVLMAFAIPVIDTTTVSVKRIMKGSSPFVGGKDHTTHHVGYLGLKDDKVAWIFIALSIIFSLLAFTVYCFISTDKLSYLFYYPVFFIIVFLTLFIIANKNKHLN